MTTNKINSTPCIICNKLTKSIRLGRANYQCEECKKDKSLSDVFFYEMVKSHSQETDSGEIPATRQEGLREGKSRPDIHSPQTKQDASKESPTMGEKSSLNHVNKTADTLSSFEQEIKNLKFVEKAENKNKCMPFAGIQLKGMEKMRAHIEEFVKKLELDVQNTSDDEVEIEYALTVLSEVEEELGRLKEVLK